MFGRMESIVFKYPISAIACTIAILGLIVLILSALAPFNFVSLKDWQPLIAAMVALLAAALAYSGAMAKVNFDREEAKNQRFGKTWALSPSRRIGTPP